jgi:hypothetical protein
MKTASLRGRFSWGILLSPVTASGFAGSAKIAAWQASADALWINRLTQDFSCKDDN